jgi:DNA-binding transcriptional ArsR family regulator
MGNLLPVLEALANPHRLRIIAVLKTDGRNYVSQLARDVGISRPLLHLHLAKLEAAGLVTSRALQRRQGPELFRSGGFLPEARSRSDRGSRQASQPGRGMTACPSKST